MKPSVAIVGTGIAGMGAAYYLRDSFDVKLYEKNDYVGGHTNTVQMREGEKRLPVDTGFMVFNEETYPTLMRLFRELGVSSYPTSMSFGVRRRASGLAFACGGISSFFAQRRRLFSARHWRFLFGIKRFFTIAHRFLEDSPNMGMTLREFVAAYGISDYVVEDFIVPMAASIWSTRSEEILEYPAKTLLVFMKNHRMLGYGIQFQWRTVEYGSDQYKRKLLAALPEKALTNRKVLSLSRFEGKARIEDERNEVAFFDFAIVATHADQALELLSSPTETEAELLGGFAYTRNSVVLHSDESVMPEERVAWASWNFLYSDEIGKPTSSIHYWMNNLQRIDSERNYFVSVDYDGGIDPERTHCSFVYEHPRFDTEAIRAQARLGELNESGPIYFCGSYFGYGFHEDALRSALDVVERIGKRELASG